MTKQSPCFPVGGSRQAVYAFLRNNGFAMSPHNDKEWTYGDRTTLHLYGSGSMATIYSHVGNFKGPLADAVNQARAPIAKARA